MAAAGGNAEAAVKLLLTDKMEDLLRIQVHPYMDGIVSFRDDYLPDGIARSYYRTSGASVGMDDKLMKLVRERKGLKK